jgi:hypothetical protein
MIRLPRLHRRLSGSVAAVAAAATAVVVVPAVHAAPAAVGPCSVTYQINQWTGGFTVAVGLTNNGAPITAWTLTWTFTGDQQITYGWNAQITQTGHSVKAVNEPYNGSLATGATTSFGFQGTFSGTNAVPTDFAPFPEHKRELVGQCQREREFFGQCQCECEPVRHAHRHARMSERGSLLRRLREPERDRAVRTVERRDAELLRGRHGVHHHRDGAHR